VVRLAKADGTSDGVEGSKGNIRDNDEVKGTTEFLTDIFKDVNI